MTKILEGYDCSPLNDRQFHWLNELLGYKKTVSRLEDEKGHCCLGVACELFAKKVKKSYKNGFLDGDVLDAGWNRHIVNFLCLTDDAGSFKGRLQVGEEDAHSLVTINDRLFRNETNFEKFVPYVLGKAHRIFTNVDKPLKKIED